MIPTWSCPEAILTPVNLGRDPNIGIPSGVPGLTPAEAEMNYASPKIVKINLAFDTIWDIA